MAKRGRPRNLFLTDKLALTYLGKPCQRCGTRMRYHANRACVTCSGAMRPDGGVVQRLANRAAKRRTRARQGEAMAIRAAGLQVTPLNRLLFRLLFNRQLTR